MTKKVIIGIVIAATTLLLFSACTRSAGQSFLPTATVEGVLPTSQPTTGSLMDAWATTTAIYIQTAVANGTITAVPTAVVTPTPGVPPTGAPTETPVPGTTPVIVVPTATPGRPATYTLQAGEYPYCIARRFNVDPASLLALNGLSDGQILQPGFELKIPQSGSYPGNRALTSHPAQYQVAVNDTIYRIACHYGDVDPSAIVAANGITLTTPLSTGQILYIP